MTRRCIGLTFALFACNFFVSQSPAAESRMWTDATGKYRTDAQFVACKAGKAELRKTDGTIIAVPMEKLSAADQDYVIANSPDLKTVSGKLVKKNVEALSNIASGLFGGGAKAVVEQYFLEVADPATQKVETLSLGQFSESLEVVAKSLIGQLVVVVGAFNPQEKRFTAVYRVTRTSQGPDVADDPSVAKPRNPEQPAQATETLEGFKPGQVVTWEGTCTTQSAFDGDAGWTFEFEIAGGKPGHPPKNTTVAVRFADNNVKSPSGVVRFKGKLSGFTEILSLYVDQAAPVTERLKQVTKRVPLILDATIER
jgi:hypothetical protein